jgi:hypothetical protein
MSQHQRLSQWSATVRHHLPVLHKPYATVSAAFSVGPVFPGAGARPGAPSAGHRPPGPLCPLGAQGRAPVVWRRGGVQASRLGALPGGGAVAPPLPDAVAVADELAGGPLPVVCLAHVGRAGVSRFQIDRLATAPQSRPCPLRDPPVRELERLKWFLWHGNVYKALQAVRSVEVDLEATVANTGDGTARKLLKRVEEFHTQIEHNKGFTPEWH